MVLAMTTLGAAVAMAALIAFAPASYGATEVTGADLAARCMKDGRVCDASIKWVYANLGACSDATLKPPQVRAKVIDWLKKHPKNWAPTDNELTAGAIASLWPCHL